MSFYTITNCIKKNYCVAFMRDGGQRRPVSLRCVAGRTYSNFDARRLWKLRTLVDFVLFNIRDVEKKILATFFQYIWNRDFAQNKIIRLSRHSLVLIQKNLVDDFLKPAYKWWYSPCIFLQRFTGWTSTLFVSSNFLRTDGLSKRIERRFTVINDMVTLTEQTQNNCEA